MECRLPLFSLTKKSYYSWLVVGTVCVGAFMAALDASIVNVALPTLLGVFRGGLHRIEWVSVAYLLTLTSLLTVFGRIADMVGRRLMYSLGFTVFIIGSAMCGAAPHLLFLIFARIIQAAGAAMLQANSVAIVTAAVSAHDRGKAIGIQGSAQAVGLLIGPALGGLLISYWGWSAIFYVNVPVGIIGTVLGILILPRDMGRQKQSFDYVGAFLLTPAFVFGLLAMTDGNEYGWMSLRILSYSALAVALLISFFLWERRNSNPMIDLSLFRIPAITLGNVAGLLSFAMMYGVLFLTPFYLEHIELLTPAQTGFLLTPVPIAMAILTPFSGFLTDRFGIRLLTTIGSVVATAGTLMLGFIGVASSDLYLITALVLVGVGQGVFTPPNNSSVMGAAPLERLGVAGGVLNMARSFGMSIGIAYAGAIYQLVLVATTHSIVGTTPTSMLPAFRNAFLATSVLGVAMAAVVMARRR